VRGAWLAGNNSTAQPMIHLRSKREQEPRHDIRDTENREVLTNSGAVLRVSFTCTSSRILPHPLIPQLLSMSYDANGSVSSLCGTYTSPRRDYTSFLFDDYLHSWARPHRRLADANAISGPDAPVLQASSFKVDAWVDLRRVYGSSS